MDQKQAQINNNEIFEIMDSALNNYLSAIEGNVDELTIIIEAFLNNPILMLLTRESINNHRELVENSTVSKSQYSGAITQMSLALEVNGYTSEYIKNLYEKLMYINHAPKSALETITMGEVENDVKILYVYAVLKMFNTVEGTEK